VSENSNPAGPAAQPTPLWRDAIVLLIAAIALFFFGWLTITMLSKTTEQSETSWSRALYLYRGVEALAFAAAGFLFGREVQRRRADEAEGRATHAQEAALSATARGEALAEAIRALEAPVAPAGGAPEYAVPAGGPPPSAIGQLVRIADRLFPQREGR